MSCDAKSKRRFKRLRQKLRRRFNGTGGVRVVACGVSSKQSQSKSEGMS